MLAVEILAVIGFLWLCWYLRRLFFNFKNWLERKRFPDQRVIFAIMSNTVVQTCRKFPPYGDIHTLTSLSAGWTLADLGKTIKETVNV